MTIEEAIKQRHSVRKYIHKPLSTEVVRALEEKIMFDKADRKLMVNRMFAVHPIERNHYITLAISFLMIKHLNCIARIMINSKLNMVCIM